MNTEFHNKKIVIIGSGFRAMMTAFYCLKESNNVTVISNNNNLHGVMSPIKWLGGNFDKGYHFFDGFNEYNKKILEEFVGSDNLNDFGYGAASYTNKKIYPGHGIPYWPHKSIFFALNSLIQYFFLMFKKDKMNIKSYNDLLDTLPDNISKVLQKACYRNTNIEAKKLSHLVSRYSHFLCYRQTILPDFLSKILKKNNFFNSRIAARRASLKLDEISLYPKGKYIGYIAEIMEKKLRKLGLKFIVSKKNIITNNGKENSINCDGQTINSDYIFIVTELDNAINLFDEKINENKTNHSVSQVLYYFATNKLYSNYQYVHGNDINIYVNRATNLSLYGEKTSNGDYVISAEVPTATDSEIWKNSETFKDIIWNELKLLKIVGKEQNYNNYKIFNIEKTLSVPLLDFEISLEKFLNLLNTKYQSKIILPGIGTFTRNIFMESLNAIFKK